jgi:nucleoside-diphosphate-sugar epimerase
MRILVFGASGFVGRNVVAVLGQDHDVFKAGQNEPIKADLTKPSTIEDVLNQTKPEVIINCAGVVDKTGDTELNAVFTKNILDSVIKTGLKPSRIIVCGSAAEYGQVSPDDLPIKETLPLKQPAAMA